MRVSALFDVLISPPVPLEAGLETPRTQSNRIFPLSRCQRDKGKPLSPAKSGTENSFMRNYLSPNSVSSCPVGLRILAFRPLSGKLKNTSLSVLCLPREMPLVFYFTGAALR